MQYQPYMPYIPYLPYIPNITYIPNIPCIPYRYQTYMPNIKHDMVTYHTHHTHHAIYIVIHTLHPPPHQGGEHTPTTPQGGRGTVLWLTHDHGGGRRGVGTLDRIYVCIYIYACEIT